MKTPHEPMYVNSSNAVVTTNDGFLLGAMTGRGAVDRDDPQTLFA
jgi:hypothetical protein